MTALQNDKLDVVLDNLLCDFGGIIGVKVAKSIRDQNDFSFVLKLLAVLCDHLYGNDNGRNGCIVDEKMR